MLQEMTMNTQASEAATLGLGFHKFDGNVPVNEVIKQIGADFTVKKEHLVRITDDEFKMLQEDGMLPTMLYPNRLIESHCATVNEKANATIGVVGADYGIIQNQQALDILNFITSPDAGGGDMRIVSAGLVHDHEPYVQIQLPQDGLCINSDDSNTEFYAFVHTSHDGTSQLKIAFSAIRVVCHNTFMANMKSIGFGIRHSSRAEERCDMSREANIKRVREFINQTNVFKQDYVDKMNFFAEKPVDAAYVNEFITNLFVEDRKLADAVRKNSYRYQQMDEMSSRMKNQMDAYRQTLEGGIGQHTKRGTRLWLFNGLTNHYSNRQRYGSDKDTPLVRATKRFDSLNGGHAARRMEMGMRMLQEA